MKLGDQEVHYTFDHMTDEELAEHIADLHRQMGILGTKLTLAELERRERRQRG